jgi:N-acetylglucosamine transport system substrate-binding protein
MKKLLATFILVVSILSLVSCKTDDSSLKLATYLGGYGRQWITKLAEKFQDENPGVTVDIEASPGLTGEISNRLQNGSNDDIFFSHGISWEKAAVQNQIEPLDDLYNQIVENNLSFAQKIEPSLLRTAKFNDHYYKVPWTNGVGGLVYNAKMFSENGWTVPETYDQLVALCDQIYNAKIKIDPTDTKPNAKTIRPFTWSADEYYWDYLVFDWWAQLEGTAFFDEYVQLGSPDLFNPDLHPGQTQALQAWIDLVAKHPQYSIDDSAGTTYMASQMNFLNGHSAMIPCAQWLEMEMVDNLDPAKMEMRLMPAPLLPNAKKDDQGNPIRVSYSVGAGDSILIPKAAPHKELAKKFLLFLAKDENIKLFTELTHGVMLGFNYENVQFDQTSLTPFSQDVIRINQESHKFNVYTSAILHLDGKISIEWPIENKQHYANSYNYFNNSGYLANPESWFNQHPYSAYDIIKSLSNTITSRWEQWKKEAGLA